MTRRTAGTPAGGGFTGAPIAAALFGMVILVTHGFGNSLALALLPRIAESFEAGYGVLGPAVATGLLAYGVGAAAGIAVVDRIPPRGLLVLCLAVSTTGFLAASGARSPGMLALCVVAIGLVSPISWAAAVHVIGRVVRSSSHGRVMAIAGAGAGAGNGVNGLFVRLFAGPEQWRLAFVIAGVLAALTIVATLSVLRRPIDRPARPVAMSGEGAAWRRIWSVPAGRTVILASMFAGAGTFTFSGYLSEVAVDELVVSPLAAAAPWWLASAVGLAMAIPAGALADRGSPVGIMAVMALVYALCLSVLALHWSYPALLVATAGFATFNFPIWGLLGLAAHRELAAGLAIRAVSGGLAAAACLAMTGIAVSGIWIERTGTFRGPVVALAILMGFVTVWLAARSRAESGGQSPVGDETPTMADAKSVGSP